ncbi:MAG: hypothetical protein DVB31_06890 [Verrucomicrobia bacterium]|nr:MAG: hypothetical protein DVB31_06890 [Verrucomicrobiota bacterium]
MGSVGNWSQHLNSMKLPVIPCLLLSLHLGVLAAADNVWQWAVRAGGEGSDAAYQLLPAPGGGTYVLSSFSRHARFGTDEFDTVPSTGDSPTSLVSRLDASGQFLWSRRPQFGTSLILPAPDGGLREVAAFSILSAPMGVLEPHWIVTRTDANGQTTSTNRSPDGLTGVENLFVTAAVDSGGGLQLLMQGGLVRKLGVDDQPVGTTVLTPAPGFPVTHMAIDGQGSVVLFGRSGGFPVVAAKYAANGSRVWIQTLGGGDFQFGASPGALILDPAGNPVITGAGDVGGPVTHFVAKLDAADGHVMWSRQLGSVPGNFGRALGIDGQGRIYNAGTFYGDAQFGAFTLVGHGYSDAFLARLTPDGVVDWVETWGGTEPYSSIPVLQDVPNGIAVSPAGDVTVGGQFLRTSHCGPFRLDAAGDPDVFVARFGVTPLVRVEPSSQSVLVGQTAGFVARATGQGPLAYQWFKGNTPIDGATQPNYVISPTKPGDEGEYYVRVTNPLSTVMSKAAVLAVRTEGIAIQFYAGILVVGEVGHTYEILKKDALGAPDWTVAATVTLTQSSQLWFDLESPGVPTRMYSFRTKP